LLEFGKAIGLLLKLVALFFYLKKTYTEKASGAGDYTFGPYSQLPRGLFLFSGVHAW